MNNQDWKRNGLYDKMHNHPDEPNHCAEALRQTQDNQQEQTNQTDPMQKTGREIWLADPRKPTKGAKVRLSGLNDKDKTIRTYLHQDLEVIAKDLGITRYDYGLWLKQDRTFGIMGRDQSCEVYRVDIYDQRHQLWCQDEADLHQNKKAKRFIDILSRLSPDVDIKIEFKELGNKRITVIDHSTDSMVYWHNNHDSNHDGDFCSRGQRLHEDHRSRVQNLLYAHLLNGGSCDRIMTKLNLCLDIGEDHEPNYNTCISLEKFHGIVGVMRECLEIRQLQREGADPRNLINRFPLYPIDLKDWNYIHELI